MRTVLEVTVVVDTSGGEAEHNKAVNHAMDRLVNAHRDPRGNQMFATQIKSSDGRVLRTSTSGTPQDEDTEEAINDIYT